jgi:hypothetical protein
VHVLDLYMHEIALYVERDENYRPQGPDAIREPVPSLKESLTTAHISALSSCLTAIDGIFECFLTMSTQSIRCLPVFNFVRIAYGVVVLMKMYFSASSPDSDLDKVINRDQMKVEEYLSKLLVKFKEASVDDRCRPASKFLVVLAMLRNWFVKQGSGANQTGPVTGNQVPAAAASSSGPPPPKPTSASIPQQQPNEYNSASTPLHLLSELATGNDSRGNQTPQLSNNPSSASQQQPFTGWPQISEPNPPSYAFDSTAAAPAASGSGGSAAMGPMQQFLPYLSDTFTADMDFSNLDGDSFDHIMGMTLSGYPTNFETGLGYVVGDQILAPMLEHMPGGSLFEF